jgi:formimidoylglutamate deiminase
MTLHFAKSALLPEGWAADVLIEVDDSGDILSVKAGAAPTGAALLKGPVIPGMPNVHSHAFQRAMAGLAERSNGGRDNFWSWREVMYSFLSRLTPEDMEAIAAQLYVEMLKSGYTGVGEFHYVHNQPDGTPYDDKAELSHRLISAAQTSGIGITHMPVLYAYGSFGGQKHSEGQRRFILSPDDIARMYGDLRQQHRGDKQIRIALAHHSLRAVSPEMMAELTAAVRALDPASPIHIHAAEQVQEVEDCLNWSGKRPVEWLLEQAEVDEHWCLIHATHMTEAETKALAASGAVAGLCPTTEGNLGDGFFNFGEYAKAGGTFGIGTDSHISINPVEDLRWLEYGQRLTHKARSLACTDEQPHVGAHLYRSALKGGAQAMGRRIGALEPGARADWLVLDETHPLLYGRAGDTLLDTFIFSGNAPLVRDVFVGGRQLVSEGRHEKEETIAARYRDFLDFSKGFSI